ncbi:MAG TPA: glycoside hydrolase, partial [Bacteroidetes bacterium]|nr:glycoside hydrolase [Bacteroidota bacterium]
QNYPNPFNPLTRIRFSIPRSSAVSLKVFDSLGRCVAVLAEELMQPGSYERTLDASALAGGVYFYRLAATQYSHTNKLLILK